MIRSANSLHSVPLTPLRRVIVRRPLTAFLVMTFAFAWFVVGLAILADQGLGLQLVRVPPQVFNALASIVGLALPAFLVTAALAGKSGVRDLLSRSLRWRVGAQWHAIALFGLLLVSLFAALAVLGSQPLQSIARNWSLLFTVFLPGVLVPFLLVNLAEETCWTGFMQHRLQERHGPLLASVMVAPAFALVHLPAFFVSGWISAEGTPFSQFPAVLLQVALLSVFAIFFRILVTWLYNGSGRSVLIVALFHSAFNLVNGQKLTPQLFGLSETLAPSIPQLAVLVLAIAVVAFTRGRLEFKPEQTTTTPTTLTTEVSYV